MKKAAFTAIVLLFATRAGAQGVDSSCLVLWQDSPLFPGPGYGWQNNDSVMVDVCQGSQHLQEFAKNWYFAYFQYYIIPVPDSIGVYGEDSSIHTWQDIDTAFVAVRDSFQSIEQKFGPFTIQHDGEGGGDTNLAADKLWLVNFTTYLNIDTIDTALSHLPDINHALGVGGPGVSFWESVNSKSSEGHIVIWPQPGNTEINISGTEMATNAKFLDPLGREITFPMTLSNNILTVDVSNQSSGVIYLDAWGQFFKILIQH